jgi:putative oxidoreductase
LSSPQCDKTQGSLQPRWAPVPRPIVGYGFMTHGFAKLSKGSDAFAIVLQAMGVPGPHFMAWSIILVALLGGFSLIPGAFGALVSLPMAAILLVAMFTVHLPYGLSSIKLLAVIAAGAQFGPPGMKRNSCISPCLAALVLAGSGPKAALSESGRTVRIQDSGIGSNQQPVAANIGIQL